MAKGLVSSRFSLVIGALAVLGACTPSQPKEPMKPYLSAAGHENAAATLDARAAAQERRYNENARLSGGMCRGRPASESGEDVCWTSMVNPTEQYLRVAAEKRRLAADHRAAAKTLRDAETAACNGIAPDDRDQSPFDHYEDILRVEPLRGGVAPYLQDPWSEGVVVTFRDVPGMSVPWLQHVVDCQLARYAALGNEVPSEPTCLLVPKGVRATVSSAPDGFAVTVRAGTRETAQELFRRADLLSVPIRRPPEPPRQPGSPEQPSAPPPVGEPAAVPMPAPSSPQ